MNTLLQRFNPVRLWNAARSNPVILKEMRSRMRGWRAAVALTAFLLLIGGTVGMIYIGFSEAGSAAQGVTVRKNIGQSIFYTITLLQLFIVSFSAPGLTSGAIAGEREHQTYDLLRTTLLTARSLVVGKLIAAVSFVLLLLTAAIPLQSIGFIFGGISLGEVVLATIILILTALAFGSMGLFFSSFIRRARIAAVLSQIAALAITILLPIFALVGISIVEAFFSGRPNAPPDWLVLGFGWLVAIGSPIATSVISEVVLIEEQTFFFFQTSVTGSSFWVPSPWLGFVVLYTLLTIGLLALTVIIVRRPEKG